MLLQSGLKGDGVNGKVGSSDNVQSARNYNANGAPARAAAAIKVEPIRRQSADPNHFLAASRQTSQRAAEPAERAAHTETFLHSLALCLEQWLPSFVQVSHEKQ